MSDGAITEGASDHGAQARGLPPRPGVDRRQAGRVVNLRHFREWSTSAHEWPDDVRRIDRRTRYGNPFRIGDDVGDGLPLRREDVVRMFREYAVLRLEHEPGWLEPLRGMRLACWCAPAPCHGDVIVELLG